MISTLAGGRDRRATMGRAWRKMTNGLHMQTSVVLPVPDAEPVLRRWWEGQGMVPLVPHISILYPFLPPRALDASVATALRRAVAPVAPFEFRLTRIGRFPGVVYLAPEPAERFVALTEALWGRWPDHPPYGGRFQTIVPHLTVVEGRHPDPSVGDLDSLLPIEAVASEIVVLVQTRDEGWQTHVRIPLGVG